MAFSTLLNSVVRLSPTPGERLVLGYTPETALEALNASNLVVEMDISGGSFGGHSKDMRRNSDTFKGIREFGYVL